jgi:tRNA(Ile2)-agmatinylcytidine synthase
VIFRSNQGTGAHLKWREKIASLKPRHQVVLEGSVSQPPRVQEGGHVFFKLQDDTGEVDCAAYEPSKEFRRTVNQLAAGDIIEAAGGVREIDSGVTLNLEYIAVRSLAQLIKKSNPRCPRCGGSTESMGREQGFRCRRCGEKLRNEQKEERVIPRQLEEGHIYLPPPRAERHLTKPACRMMIRKTYTSAPLHFPWHG